MPQTLDQKKYAKLLVNVLPQPITSEAQHKALLRWTSCLMKKEELTPEETALLTLVSVLISDYERKRHADLFSGRMTPAEVLSYLIDENHLTQRDFPSIPQSRISEILTGKRKISKSQAQIFGARFKVNPILFLY